MREEYSQHIHHTTNEVQSGRACACVCTSAQAASAAAKNQMGKCGARYLCASGQGGSRPEPQPAVTVQLYIRHLDWRLYQ